MTSGALTSRVAATMTNESQLVEGEIDDYQVECRTVGRVCFQLPVSTVSNQISIETARLMHVSCNCSVEARKLANTQ